MRHRDAEHHDLLSRARPPRMAARRKPDPRRACRARQRERIQGLVSLALGAERTMGCTVHHRWANVFASMRNPEGQWSSPALYSAVPDSSSAEERRCKWMQGVGATGIAVGAPPSGRDVDHPGHAEAIGERQCEALEARGALAVAVGRQQPRASRRGRTASGSHRHGSSKTAEPASQGLLGRRPGIASASPPGSAGSGRCHFGGWSAVTDSRNRSEVSWPAVTGTFE
jgi:hypothetical protein